MFIKTHNTKTDESDIDLAFIKSLNVLVYPCGRRRSEIVDNDDNGDGNITEIEQYRIPFDPEARLNTEANNRRHSSLNGFTQTYLNKWDENEKFLSLVLSGYLFNIKLDTDYQAVKDFGDKIIAFLPARANKNSIYANILIEETKLFEGFDTYYTEVLRDQSDQLQSGYGLTNLDLLADEDSAPEPNNFYFSGLSFSTTPLSGDTSTHSVKFATNNGLKQYIISLHVLEKISDTWQIYQPSLLPKIEHGSTEDSIKVKTIFAKNLIQDTGPVPSIKVVKNDDKWQLQLSNIAIED